MVSVLVRSGMTAEANNEAGSTDIYDVILNVTSHGIHNPVSLHAFKAQKIYLIPTKCFVCKAVIYPYTDVAKCIRCHQYAHRTCCNPSTQVPTCQGWGNSSISSQDPDKVEHPFGADLNAASPKEAPSRLISILNIPEYINSSFPQPGSPDCKWKAALQELSKEFYLTRMATVPSSLHGLEKLVNRLLLDSSTFPGRVFRELRDMYMYMNFLSDSDFLVHAREALDNISCSVISVLPQSVGDDNDSLKLVVTVVDWRVLRHNDGKMYDKVFGAAKRIGTRMDNALLARLYQQQEMEQQGNEPGSSSIVCSSIPSFTCVVDMPNYNAIHDRLGKIPGEYAVMDKLERLVETLKLIASSAPVDQSVDAAKTETEHKQSELSLEETMQNYDIDADMLMQKFCQVLSHETLKYEFYWNAESIFVDYMCREYNWLLGAEGYALVTLQQALRALCPTAAITSACQTGVDIEKHLLHNKPAVSLYSSSRDSRDDDDIRSRASKDDESCRKNSLDANNRNNEALLSSSSKLKGKTTSPMKIVLPVLGSE